MKHITISMQLLSLMFGCWLSSCNPVPNPPKPPVNPNDTISIVTPPDTVEVNVVPNIEDMTLREKVGQIFFICPDVINNNNNVVYGNALITNNFNEYPCGGFILFAANVKQPDQLKLLTSFLHGLDNYPLICIDEEGGGVARIGKNENFNVPTYTNMWTVGQTGDPHNAYEAGCNIGSYLNDYQIDIDFAPVADVWTNPDNSVIGKRAFSANADTVAMMTAAFYSGLQENHIVGCYKHFPGHGNTSTDTHSGYAETKKTWEELQECELIPFQKGIANGIEMIMTAHIAVPNVTGTGEPSSLSYTMLTEKLRNEMDYTGIIITDAMNMGAITTQYTSVEAAVKAIQAGVDILLMPKDYYTTFDAIVEAVENGTISEERVNESVARVLNLKKQLLQSTE